MKDPFELNEDLGRITQDLAQFPQIVSLDDSELVSQRRSKSLSHSRNDNQPKRFLLKKKETENESIKQKEIHEINTLEDADVKTLLYEGRNHNNKLQNNILGNNILGSSKLANQLHKIDTINTLNSLNYSKSEQNTSDLNTQNYQEPAHNVRNLQIHDELMSLKDKYNHSKVSLEQIQKKEEYWRRLYFTLLEDSILYEETIKNLIEENRIHQEYIINLENKLNKVIISCNVITDNFHNNLSQTLCGNYNNNHLNSFTGSSSMGNDFTFQMKNMHEVLNDYKRQLEILAEEKDSLSTNLSISRHQQLQLTMKLEVMQTRLYNFERGQLEDWKAVKAI
jgi:hypothetical protein